MTGELLAASQARAAAPASHWIEIGLLAGLLAGLLLPAWLGWIALIADAAVLGVLHAATAHAGRVNGTWLIIALIALGAGLYFGRIRGLRQLGEHEYRVRHASVRGISRFF